MLGRWALILMVIGGLLVSACRARPATQSTPQTLPTTPSTPNPASLAAFFPEGRGRDLILEYCGTCHSLTRILTARKDPDGWAYYLISRRPDIAFLRDEEMQTVLDYGMRLRVEARSAPGTTAVLEYLTENFGPDDPVPDIPPELPER